jgi:hypothetical protein
MNRQTPGQRAFESMQQARAIDAVCAGVKPQQIAKWSDQPPSARQNWEIAAKAARKRSSTPSAALPTCYFVSRVGRKCRLTLREGKLTSNGRVRCTDGTDAWPSDTHCDPRGAILVCVGRYKAAAKSAERSAKSSHKAVAEAEALLAKYPRARRKKAVSP